MDIKEIVNLMDIYQKGQLTNEQLKLVQNRQFDNINLSNVVGGKIYDIDDYSPELQDIVHSGDLLSHLDKRIKSAKNISQITRAMQMVAASRMRQAQQKAIATKPYAEKIYEITAFLS